MLPSPPSFSTSATIEGGVAAIGNLTKIPTCEKQKKKIEKIHAKEKQSHAQDNIYVVRQFAYVHEIAGISL